MRQFVSCYAFVHAHFSSLAFAFFRYFQLSFLNFSLDTHLCDKLFCSISIKKQIRVRRLNQTDVFKLWPLHIRFTSLLPIGWKFKISIFSFYFFLSSSMFSISFFFSANNFCFIRCLYFLLIHSFSWHFFDWVTIDTLFVALHSIHLNYEKKCLTNHSVTVFFFFKKMCFNRFPTTMTTKFPPIVEFKTLNRVYRSWIKWFY